MYPLYIHFAYLPSFNYYRIFILARLRCVLNALPHNIWIFIGDLYILPIVESGCVNFYFSSYFSAGTCGDTTYHKLKVNIWIFYEMLYSLMWMRI